MKDEDIRILYLRHVSAYEAAGLDFAGLRRHVSQVRRDGYAVISDSVSKGVTGIGVGLGQGEPFAVWSKDYCRFWTTKEEVHEETADNLIHPFID